MLANGLSLLLALAATATVADDPVPVTGADLARDYIGYELFDPGLVKFKRMAVDQDFSTPLLYSRARDALDTYDGCLQRQDIDRQEIEAAYQQMVGTQLRHVSAAQWQGLQQALRKGRSSVPLRGVLECGTFAATAPRFDVVIDDLMQTAAELQSARAGEGDTRSDALRPVLGLQMSANTSIQGVPDGGRAAESGLRKDDLVVAVDGTSVKTVYGIEQVLKTRKPGDRVALIVQRVEFEPGPPRVSELTLELELESRAAVLARGQGR